MKTILLLLILTSTFFLGGENSNADRYLVCKSKCTGKKLNATVCISEPYLLGAGDMYQNISIYSGKIKCPTHAERQMDERKKRKRKYTLATSFDYRVQGSKLYFLTTMGGNRSDIESDCQIDEFVLFDLHDKIGSERISPKGGCEGLVYSRFVNKHKIGVDSLFTFKVYLESRSYGFYLESLSFDEKFNIRAFTYHIPMYHNSGDPRKICPLDSILYYN